MRRKYPVVVFKDNGLNALYQDLILLKATLIVWD